MFGRELVLSGLRWGVGNGESIRILHDSWIPGLAPGTFKTLEALPENAKVQLLLNEEGSAWDMDTVRHFFAEEMAQTIQQVQISKRGSEDFVSWPHARFGVYTVRPAYNLARRGSFFSSRGAASSGDSSDLAIQENKW